MYNDCKRKKKKKRKKEILKVPKPKKDKDKTESSQYFLCCWEGGWLYLLARIGFYFFTFYV
jgi:hypothetical protein